MNYYEHHIGDYIEATAHLSFIEDGAYGRLMRKYYASEKPLPADLSAVERLVGARTKEERKAVKSILDEFFELRDDGWHQARCDAEIVRFNERTAKQKAISMMGVEARRTVNGKSTVGHTVGTTHGQPSVNGRLTPPVSSLQSPPPNEDLTPKPPFEKGGSRRKRSSRESEPDPAAAVWLELIASDGARPPRDSKLQAAIDAVGGWSRIQMREQGVDSNIVRKQFCEAYRSLVGP